MEFKAKYFDLWMKAWDFHKRWSDNNGAKEEWEQIVDEAGEMCRQQNEPFLRELMLAVISEFSELERKDKQGKKDGGGNEEDRK